MSALSREKIANACILIQHHLQQATTLDGNSFVPLSEEQRSLLRQRISNMSILLKLLSSEEKLSTLSISENLNVIGFNDIWYRMDGTVKGHLVKVALQPNEPLGVSIGTSRVTGQIVVQSINQGNDTSLFKPMDVITFFDADSKRYFWSPTQDSDAFRAWVGNLKRCESTARIISVFRHGEKTQVSRPSMLPVPERPVQQLVTASTSSTANTPKARPPVAQPSSNHKAAPPPPSLVKVVVPEQPIFSPRVGLPSVEPLKMIPIAQNSSSNQTSVAKPPQQARPKIMAKATPPPNKMVVQQPPYVGSTDRRRSVVESPFRVSKPAAMAKLPTSLNKKRGAPDDMMMMLGVEAPEDENNEAAALLPRPNKRARRGPIQPHHDGTPSTRVGASTSGEEQKTSPGSQNLMDVLDALV